MAKTRKYSVLCTVIISIYLLPHTAHGVNGQCAEDIIGKWQQSQVEFQGNKIKDDSQSWEFMENGTVRFMKTTPAIDVSGDYSCDGDIIYMKGSAPGRLRILEYDGEVMAWEHLDHGGGITHIKRAKE